MPQTYEPKDHIYPLDIAPKSESILDQREITVRTFETKLPFDYKTLAANLANAWLSPFVRLGIFALTPKVSDDEIHVVLGLQGELSVRAYDFDERRPLWYSWQDLIVDTMAIRYFRSEGGHIYFTTAGGGLRITDEKLSDFNATYLKIPPAAVQKRQFDLNKLRELCFNRFPDRLYMVRFSNPAAKGYESIDHALFQSRKYIDPKTQRLHEVRSDTQVTIESFDSDIDIITSDISSSIEVRFAIRGLSGALRLRFPKVTYKSHSKTDEEQTRVFYRLVDETVKSIIDADYYARRGLSLPELERNPEFPELADTAPYKAALCDPEQLKSFFSKLDLGAARNLWLPHLRAIDELIVESNLDVAEPVRELTNRDAGQTENLVLTCKSYDLIQLGNIAADLLCLKTPTLPANTRARSEEVLLEWYIDHLSDCWDVDTKSGFITVKSLKWHQNDLSLDAFAVVLWKLVSVLNTRLNSSLDDARPILEKFAWCSVMAKAIPANHKRICAALRLVTEGRVPRTPEDAASILKAPVADLRVLDMAVLQQFGLPLWPRLSAIKSKKGLLLHNNGIGSALAITLNTPVTLFSDNPKAAAFDLLAGDSVAIHAPKKTASIALSFEKFGKRRQVILPVVDGISDVGDHLGATVTNQKIKCLTFKVLVYYMS